MNKTLGTQSTTFGF